MKWNSFLSLILAFAENFCSDTHQSCPFCHCQVPVVAHSHAYFREGVGGEYVFAAQSSEGFANRCKFGFDDGFVVGECSHCHQTTESHRLVLLKYAVACQREQFVDGESAFRLLFSHMELEKHICHFANSLRLFLDGVEQANAVHTVN